MTARSFAAGLLLALLAGAAWSAPVDAGRVTVELVSERTALVPGEDIWVALRQKIDPGWHTYWINPGDSGEATSIKWDLPEGFAAGELQFPFPARIPYGPLMNFGYKGEVMYPVRMRVPKTLQGREVTLAAEVEWLVCEEICIPEEASLQLKLPVASSDAQSAKPDEHLAKTFQEAREKLPRKGVFDAEVLVRQDADGISGFSLQLRSQLISGSNIKSADYFPYREGLIANPAEQVLHANGDSLTLELKPGYDAAAGVGTFGGIVVLEAEQGAFLKTAYEISPRTRTGAGQGLTLFAALFFALAGGLILNLMPCVFPVLSIKLLSLAGQVGESPGLMRLHGLVYLAGVLVTFAAIGLALLLLRAAGAEIGWGFQLQSPWLVTLLVYLLFLVGLSLSGFMTLGAGLMGVGGSWSEKTGLLGSFATGTLAVFVAAPCTAPFMGPALGFAVTQPTAAALGVFVALGFGFALPYVLLSFAPWLMNRLPRPGPWMEKLKELLAFPMYAAAVWLLWVLGQQLGANGILLGGGGLVILTFAIWLLKSAEGAGSVWRFICRTLAVFALLLAVLLPMMFPASQPVLPAENTAPASSSGSGPAWQTWSREALVRARSQGPVFVNFTAAWCITCKVNEAVALSSARVADKFAEHGVTYLKGDWTLEDPAITAALTEFGRSGVPLYLVYTASENHAEPRVLPQILTEAMVMNAVEAASR